MVTRSPSPEHAFLGDFVGAMDEAVMSSGEDHQNLSPAAARDESSSPPAAVVIVAELIAVL